MQKQNWYKIKNSAESEKAIIYLYGEIGAWGITAADFTLDYNQIDKNKKIELHIHSDGGEVFDGNVIYNILKNHKAGVICMIDGIAASMASVIAMAGGSISMASNGWIMIHNPMGGVYGDSEEFAKKAELLAKLKTQLVQIYSNRTGIAEDEISKMMDNETWLDAKQALELKFIDFAYGAEDDDEFKAVALNLSKFKNNPVKFDNSTNMYMSKSNLKTVEVENKTAENKPPVVIENKQQEPETIVTVELPIVNKVKLLNKQILDLNNNLEAEKLKSKDLNTKLVDVLNQLDLVEKALGVAGVPDSKVITSEPKAQTENILNRADFEKLSPVDKDNFIRNSGKLI